MPAKKKHNKGKGTFQGKQRRLERRSQAKPDGVTIQAASVIAAPAAAAAAPRQAPGPRVMPAKFNYPNIVKELRSIAILFAAVLVVMVAMALLLR
jgi:hypothetical protein